MENDRKGIDAIIIFLTYSRVPEKWTKEYVLEMLKEKFMYKIKTKEKSRYDSRIVAYIIAEELHQEGVGEGEYERGKHYHCYMEFDKKTRIRNIRDLDIEGIHGNYQAVRNKMKVIAYCRKYGNYIEGGFPGIEQKELLESKSMREFKEKMFDKMGYKDKEKFMEEVLTELERREDKDKVIIKIPVYAFQKVFEPLREIIIRINKGRAKGILMYGEPESGKTSFAYRIAEATGERVIVIRDPKELSEHYEGERIILFDELEREVIEREQSFYKMVISEIQARTKPYYGTKNIKYPRLVLLATNEDIRGWKIDKGLQNRLIIVKTYKDGKYKLQKYNEEGELVEVER